MITRTRRGSSRKAPPTYKRISIKDWQYGKTSSQDSDRSPPNGLIVALNGILKQDGTAAPRPSLVRYGTQPIGTVLGEIAEFTRRVGGTIENYELSIQVVGGVARAYYRKDGGTWTLAAGKTYNITARAHLVPIRDVDANFNDEDKVLILNGEDFLSYLDINTLAVVPFTALSSPSAPTLAVGAGLTGPNFQHRYRVTAGNRGETPASVATAATTSKLRSEWTAATEYIDVTITRVTGAQRYHVYYGTETGQETYLFSVDDPGSGTTFTWRDTGTADQNIYRPAPVSDTTAGPICTRGAFVNGQVFLVGDKVNPKYVRFGGVGKSILDFSPYGGGGYEPVGGNKEVPVVAKQFRKNGGDPAVTILCKGTNGFGKRYTLSPQTVGNISFFAVTEENGNDGTEAPDSVITAFDQLFYLSRDGGKTTLTKAQVQTILSTEKITDRIQKLVSRLNTTTLDLSVGLVWESRLYWLVAAGSTKNNQMIVLDLSDMRKGAWMEPWSVPGDWMWLYNDNSGKSHFCVLVNNTVFEFTDTIGTQDDGKKFGTGFKTSILKFSDDGQEYGEVAKVTFVIDKPQGKLYAKVSGKTEDGTIDVVGNGSYVGTTSLVGWGEAGWSRMSWGRIGKIPKTTASERTEIEIEVGEEMKWLQAELSSQDANVFYEWADLIVEYINTGTKD